MGGNIFTDSSGHHRKKIRDHKPTPDSTKKKASKKYSQEEADAANMLQRMKEMKDDLNLKLDYLQNQAKQHHINIDLFIQSHSGPLVKEIEELKQKEKALREFEKNKPEFKKQNVETKSVAKSSDKLTQERKGKLRGVRNKWIPVK